MRRGGALFGVAFAAGVAFLAFSFWTGGATSVAVDEIASVGQLEVGFRAAKFAMVRRHDGTIVGDDMRLIVAFTIVNTGNSPIPCDVSFSACSRFGSSYETEDVRGDVLDDANGVTTIGPGESATVYAVASVFTEASESVYVTGDLLCSPDGQRQRFTFCIPLTVTRGGC